MSQDAQRTDDTAPDLQQPLSCTWREWIARPTSEHAVDAIVVGSGYGGSVAALRLAEKGYRVLLLERGSEYLPGDFPNDFSGVPKHFRVNIPGRGVPMGRASGLIEVSVGQGMVAITGNGLGGGSLINAGVMVRPDPDVFAQEAWPAAIRHGHGPAAGRTDLQRAFAKAKAGLSGYRFQSPQPSPLLKTAALLHVAATLREDPVALKTSDARLAIDPVRCTACGDCVSGCNVPGAKLTLSSNYLRKAVDTGRVQIVTQAQVYRFEPCDGTDPDEVRWRVVVFSTDAQHQVLTQREAGTLRPDACNPDPASTVQTVTASTLIIAAGTLGSTQLLQRSQALAGEALAFSQALGTRLSGNGDSVSVKTGEAKRVNAVGYGADATLRAMRTTDADQHSNVVGPTITTHLDLRDRSKPLDQRILLQDGAIPGAIARPFAELIATAYSVAQLDRWWFRNPQPRHASDLDPLAASRALAAHTQVFLAMGHDGSPGRMVWLAGMDTSAPVFSGAEHLRTYQEQQRLFDRLRPSGTHVHSPLWQWMPPGLGGRMKGAMPPATVTTVHPLGGCPMGDDPTTSVVNHLGQVWIHEPPDPQRQGTSRDKLARTRRPNRPQVYPGLFVLDGSIVPTSLGCNPLLTITALAERSMAQWCAPIPPAKEKAPWQSAPRPRAHFERKRVAADACLGETLRAEGKDMCGPWFRHDNRERLRMIFTATLKADDFELMLEQKNHPMAIAKATLELLEKSDKKGSDESTTPPPTVLASYASQPGGTFEFLRAQSVVRGRWVPAWCTLQLLLWLAPLVWLLFRAAQWLRRWIGDPDVGWAWAESVPLLREAALAAALTLAWCALPYPRTVLTWYALRGWSDLAHRERVRERTLMDRLRKYFIAAGHALALLRQLMHATECRDMLYSLTLEQTPTAQPGPTHGYPQRVCITAQKRVMYRATLTEWVRWLGGHARRRMRAWRPATPAHAEPDDIPPLRPGLWEQVMDARMQVREGAPEHSRVLASGTMKMRVDNLFNRAMAQLGERGDTTSGLVLLAGYALLLLRFAITTRLLDFRLPNLSNVPVPDAADPTDVCIRGRDGASVTPELHWLRVRRGRSSSDQGTESVDALNLRLWRYRCTRMQPAAPPVVEPGTWMGLRVRRARAVLLLHAFGQSGLSFTHQAEGSLAGSNLAEAFHHRGFEVWILDSRMSTRSGYATEPTTVDMQARHDVPGAVNHILAVIEKEVGSGDPLQISAFGQCIGAASLWMALLNGRLSHERMLPTDAKRPYLSKLACVAFSQVHALVQGQPIPRSKTWLPGLLQALVPRGAIPFAARGQDGFALNILDRLLSTLPVPAAERVLSRNEDGVATCKRIRFIEAPLFRHEKMHPSTVAQMNRLFGDSNLRLFAQARRFIERGRLVDENGVNRYVTDDNIRAHLAMPVQLLHGERNELFDVQSAYNTARMLDKLGCHWLPQGTARPLISPTHGHLDVLLGINAPTEVFDKLVRFYEQAQTLPVEDERSAQSLWVLRAPLVGPWVGRIEPRGSAVLARVVFLVDDLHGGGQSGTDTTLLVVRQEVEAGSGQYQTLNSVDSGFFVVPVEAPASRPAYRTAWIDVTIDASPPPTQPLRFQVFTAHPVRNIPSDRDTYVNPVRIAAVAPRAHGSGIQTLPMPAFRPMTENLANSTVLSLADDSINGALERNLEDHRVRELKARETGMPLETPLLARCHFQVPAQSVASVATPAVTTVDFVAACCRHPGLDVDAMRVDRAFDSTKAARQPAFALLVGDQIYADATAGLVDPLSPAERYLERYESAFGPMGMGRFLSRTPTYMVPDDHEWIDAQPNGSPLLKWSWANRTPDKPYRVQEKGIFRWAGDALTAFQRSLSWPLDFLREDPRVRQHWTEHRHGCINLFLLDSRSWRNRQVEGSPQAHVMDETAFRLLLERLAQPQDGNPLQVIVTGSVVIPGLHPNADPANPGAIDTWQYAPEQRRQLLDTLVTHHPRRFLLVSGDYHVSGAVALQRDGKTVGAAIVVPPIYAPLPYANTAPEHVFTQESIMLNGGRLSQQVCDGGLVLRGSGLAHLTVERRGDGYRIVCERQLTVLEMGGNTTPRCEIVL